ncbi:MAG: site-2 protease family protein [Legionellaceae bacterium]|nr:site-2 protease family protein [Legionellaceae bacterium]
MHIIISIVTILICLLCVLGIHEGGHALAAKLLGVKINRVSLGFGKPIVSWTRRSGYTLDICLWPLGGCVHLLNSRVAPVSPKDYPFCFDKKPIWVRTIILLSGSVANSLVAGLALLFMFMLGFQQLPPVIASVSSPSNAATAGLHPGDQLTQVAGHDTLFWRDVSMQFIRHIGQANVPVTACSSNTNCRTTTLDLRLWRDKNKNFEVFSAIGIKPDTTPQRIQSIQGLPFWPALSAAWSKLLSLVCFFVIMIKQLLTGNLPFAALIGPFKLFSAIIDSFSQGLAIFLYFIANFSLAMALINILPIPSLDGGSILYGFIEKIRGKPISIALEILIYRLLFIVFTLVFFQLIMNDLRHYF